MTRILLYFIQSPGKLWRQLLPNNSSFTQRRLKWCTYKEGNMQNAFWFLFLQNSCVRWGQPVLDLFLLGECMWQLWPPEYRLSPMGQPDHMIPYLSLWKRKERTEKTTWRMTFWKMRVLDLTIPVISFHLSFKINSNRSSQLVLKGSWYEKTLKAYRLNATVYEERWTEYESSGLLSESYFCDCLEGQCLLRTFAFSSMSIRS